MENKGGSMCTRARVRLLVAGSLMALVARAAASAWFRSQSVETRELEVFLVALQKAVASDDRRKVASMIRYPIVVRVGGGNVLFKIPSSLVASYDLVFTPRRKKLIAEAKADQLFRNWKGAMIDDGDIWINEVDGGRLKIVTINAEPAADRMSAKPAAFKVHPMVFTIIGSVVSDSESPVVTEINLDAVVRNTNQFPQDNVKQDSEWTTYRKEDGRGFTLQDAEERGRPIYRRVPE